MSCGLNAAKADTQFPCTGADGTLSATYTVTSAGALSSIRNCYGAVTLDASVLSLPYATYMPNVTTLAIPATTTSIFYAPFVAATKLVSFSIDASNANYMTDSGVIYNKNGTTMVAYPGGSPATTFTVPATVTTIQYNAFINTVNLRTVEVGPNVTSMDYAFNENGSSGVSIQAINVDATNPNYSSSSGVFFNKAQTVLLTYPMGKTDLAYVVPSTVTRIRSLAYNKFLATITLSTNLTTIDTYAFENDTALSTVTIPASVSSLGSFPFYGNSALRSINVDPANSILKSIDGVLFNKSGTQLIEYPDGRTDQNYVIPDGVISMPLQWIAGGGSLRNLTVPSSVTTIGSGYIGNWYQSNSYLIFSGNSSITSISGSYAKNIIYCGSTNSAITNYAVSQSTIVKCQASSPSFSLSQGSESVVRGSSINGYTITSVTPADFYSISPAITNTPGLSFNSTSGLISGTPTTSSAVRTYTITGTNGLGSSTASYSITVSAPPAAPAFSLSRSSEVATTGSAITGYTISSTGGAIASYSIAPSIGNGLAFDASTGLISGTPIAAASIVAYTITATNATSSTSRTYSLTVNAALGAPAFSLSQSSEAVVAGSPIIGYTLSSTGGAVASYSISPAVSSGLSFSSSTGLISGTPTASAAAVTYTITATNATSSTTRAYTLTINAKPEPVPDPVQQSKIGSLSVLTASSGVSTPLVISGTFVEKVSAIQINGVGLPSGSWSQTPTSISFTMPNNPPGVYQIQLFNGSAPVLKVQNFTFTAPVPIAQTPIPTLKKKVIYIRCAKLGHGTRIVYGVNPVCPDGYLKK